MNHPSSPHAPFDALRSALDAALAEGPEAITQGIPVLARFLRDVPPADLVHAVLAQVAEAPQALTRAGEDHVGLASGASWDLTFRIFRATSRGSTGSVHGLAEHVLLGVVGPATLPLEVFEEGLTHAHDLFDRSRALREPALRVLAPGDVASFEAGRHALRPGTTPSTTFALVLRTTPVRPFVWSYDPSTREATGFTTADPRITRLEFAARLLGEMGLASSVGTLAALAEHAVHSVRWEAMRALFRIDARAGAARLEAARHDPHPHVRRAAERSLAQLASIDAEEKAPS